MLGMMNIGGASAEWNCFPSAEALLMF